MCPVGYHACGLLSYVYESCLVCVVLFAACNVQAANI